MVYLNSLHIVRAFIGMWVVLTLPRTHAVLDELTEDYKALKQIVVRKADESCQKAVRPLAYYSIVTCFTFVLDFLALAIGISTTELAEDLDVIGIVLTVVLLCKTYTGFDSYLVLWYISLKFMYPPDIWSNLGNIFRFGFDSTKWTSSGLFIPFREMA